MPKRGSMKKQRGCAMKGGNCAAKSMMGGDASTHAERIYGAAGHQSAGQGNLIATSGRMGGGYRHRRNKKNTSKSMGGTKGGMGIVDMAVPAALLYGQQKYAGRSRKNKFSKSRFTRRR